MRDMGAVIGAAALLVACSGSGGTSGFGVPGAAASSGSTSSTSSGGGAASSSSVTSSSTGGAGGSGGQGGAGGAGGAPCVPKTCQDIPRACGTLYTGCGEVSVDCPNVCGTSGVMYCDKATNQCACQDASSIHEAQIQCDQVNQNAMNFCGPQGCKANRCDDDPQSKNIAPTCIYVGNWEAIVFMDPPGKTGLFCCLK